jgi:alpha-ribazole phosphatase
VIEFIHQLQSQHQGQTILIITHAGVIRALLANVLNLALNEVFKFQLDYGSVTQLTFNDTVHNVGYINR